jgi:hypothetical protein
MDAIDLFRKELLDMTKAAIIISAVLLFAGVAAAGSLTGLGQDDTPTIETPTLSTSTGDDVRREDRREAEDRGRENEPDEDLRGPCDEAEHAGDPRCTGAQGDEAHDDHDRGEDRSGPSANSGPGNAEDRGGNEDDSGHGGNSGHGGGGEDD